MSDTEAAFLWRVGARRCHVTPAGTTPPYLVVILDEDADGIIEQSFDTHNAAVAFAIEELRRAAEQHE